MKSHIKYNTQNTSHVIFQETSRDFRTELPNILFELLESKEISPSALILYSTYRRIAGEHGGCWIGTRRLAEKCQLSPMTITKMKKALAKPLKKLNGKSLIYITPGNPKLEEADTVTIIDIWPENYAFFKNKLTCAKREHGGVLNESMGVCQSVPRKKEPYKKEPYKNPPPLTPPKKAEKKELPKKESLRSEEEEILIHKSLEDSTLSPKDKMRLSREFSDEEVSRALKISKTQVIKKSLMSLLINILSNPHNWTEDADKTQLQTQQQRIAHEYNESLRKRKKLAYEALMKPGAKSRETRFYEDIAIENEKTILENHMKIILNGIITPISLNSFDFAQDIKDAITQLG